MAGYDDTTDSYLASIQHKLYNAGFTGNHTKNLPQHITLGVFSARQENECIELVKKTSARFSQFEVAFNHIGIFGGSKVLFVSPDTNRKLLELKEVFGSSFDWTPHTTMLIDSPGNILLAIPIITDEFSKFRGQVERLFLYEFWPTRHIFTTTLSKTDE
jgi:2'-5' RNA ligase